ncbi:hypothetical protein U1Q18_013198 [Sarracenia purpurea var. burkii]
MLLFAADRRGCWLLIEVGLVWCLRGPSLLQPCDSGKGSRLCLWCGCFGSEWCSLMVQQHLSLGSYSGANAFSPSPLDCRGLVVYALLLGRILIPIPFFL